MMRERLESLSIPEPNTGCWLWLGSLDGAGYGCMRVGSRRDGSRALVSTHRAAWEAFVGPIPLGLYVCHRCDQRVCLNPDHLFLGSHRDNMADMAAKGRRAGVSVKLTVDQAREIRRRRGAGETLASVASEFGVSANTVSAIATGKIWSRA
jgi:HNH endonuclease